MELSKWVSVITTLCTTAIFSSVATAFVMSRYFPKAVVEKKTRVETGTMTAFFFLFFLLLKVSAGYALSTSSTIVIIGLIITVFGTVINVWGRFYLGTNWANQIKIYPDHKLVRSGPYRLVRHPLYASLLWIFCAVSVVYGSWLAMLATLCIFYPMMVKRARLEEDVLSDKYEEYAQYKRRVGRFLPKIYLRS